VFRRKGLNDGPRAIAAAIIHKEDLQFQSVLARRLRQLSVQQAETFGFVVHGDDDGNHRSQGSGIRSQGSGIRSQGRGLLTPDPWLMTPDYRYPIERSCGKYFADNPR